MTNILKTAASKVASVLPTIKEVKDTAADKVSLAPTPKPEVEVASKVTPKVAEISVYVAAGSVVAVAIVALVKLLKKGA